MAQNKKIISRLLFDLAGALIGLAISIFFIQFFGNGISFPLESSDGLILISATFISLLLSSVVCVRFQH